MDLFRLFSLQSAGLSQLLLEGDQGRINRAANSVQTLVARTRRPSSTRFAADLRKIAVNAIVCDLKWTENREPTG